MASIMQPAPLTRSVGLISDTHGLLRPEATRALAGTDLIIHAGDIGDGEILDHLQELAPVHAVRGNNDRGPWARRIPHHLALQLGGVGVYVLHDLKELDIDPSAAGFQVVITGHSHRALIEERHGVLFVNPGSAGPRRFRLPVTLGCLELAPGKPRARVIELL